MNLTRIRFVYLTLHRIDKLTDLFFLRTERSQRARYSKIMIFLSAVKQQTSAKPWWAMTSSNPYSPRYQETEAAKLSGSKICIDFECLILFCIIIMIIISGWWLLFRNKNARATFVDLTLYFLVSVRRTTDQWSKTNSDEENNAIEQLFSLSPLRRGQQLAKTTLYNLNVLPKTNLNLCDGWKFSCALLFFPS